MDTPPLNIFTMAGRVFKQIDDCTYILHFEPINDIQYMYRWVEIN